MTELKNGYNNKNDEKTILCEEIKIPVPWGHVSGKWWGSRDKQPVLAIHGWQDNAGSFDNLAPLIANDIPIFCVDLPGHGLSSHYPQGQYYYIFWDGILIVRRIVKHFNWINVQILGHSLGGAIGFLYAASFPNDVESYISIDIASPAVRDPVQMTSVIGESADKYLKYETLFEGNQPCYEKKEMLDIIYSAHNGSITKESCEVLMKRGIQHSSKPGTYSFTRDARLKVSALGFMTLDQVLEFASRITCRVLNIRGNPGMKWVCPENYDLVLDKIAETAKCMQKHVIPGTHHLHLNNAESVADVIKEFFIV